MATTVTNKNGIEFDIDALATDVNGKMDKDGVNATCPVVISRTPNEQGGVVEIWSDGYCVQTGTATNNSSPYYDVTFTQAFKDANYVLSVNKIYANTNWDGVDNIYSKSNNGFRWYSYTTVSRIIDWRAEGYIR